MTTADETPRSAAKPVRAAKAAAKTASKAPKAEKKSIFDEDFSPVGSERRKAWSQYDRRSR
ncbi:hypothetical protein KO516_03845 [Citreicella sp. C3M06]|uniref:hypothetical protein n=1 Tax=Citreicella sp. C3M06 TaxID=2841564 RepID=UPI001C09D481|nr:hypothetical protein [Citreicella sp. C3M06]MBU2959972.1 hypothetical protein [Citreicella sp. C3M06]